MRQNGELIPVGSIAYMYINVKYAPDKPHCLLVPVTGSAKYLATNESRLLWRQLNRWQRYYNGSFMDMLGGTDRTRC
ncbi:MAG: hypothetical protein JWO84_184 [Parcubacteria group bacterium]|nr:hypothetical protein [Parcubacteria group bacterium]